MELPRVRPDWSESTSQHNMEVGIGKGRGLVSTGAVSLERRCSIAPDPIVSMSLKSSEKDQLVV